MPPELNTGLTAAAISLVLCSNAWGLDPQNIKLSDGVVFTPTLQVGERYDDNFRAVEEGVQASWITSIAPSFVLAAEGRKSAYALGYTATSDIFHSSQKDNNTDHQLTLDAAY